MEEEQVMLYGLGTNVKMIIHRDVNNVDSYTMVSAQQVTVQLAATFVLLSVKMA